MVALPDNVLTRKMRWEAVGCLYAGWQKLLGGSNPIGLERRGLIAWDVAWGLTEGDRALEERFPAAVFTDPAQLPAANYVTAECIQIHGGVGYTWECDAHLYLRRAKVNDLLLGYQGWQRQRVADLYFASL